MAPVDRWKLFARLSLVCSRFRAIAILTALRNVRAVAHSTMDTTGYANVRRQHLALVQPGPQGDSGAEEAYMASLHRYTTVALDVSMLRCSRTTHRDEWLKDDTAPPRPLGDSGSGPFGETTPDSEYGRWLASRRRAHLSGWFADLLASVPDCRAVCIEADPGAGLEDFSPATHALILEGLWWWPSLARVEWRVVQPTPRRDFDFRSSPVPPPGLAPLPAVREVHLMDWPMCYCKERAAPVAGRKGVSSNGKHRGDCPTQRIMLPYTGLRRLVVEDPPEDEDDAELRYADGVKPEVTVLLRPEIPEPWDEDDTCWEPQLSESHWSISRKDSLSHLVNWVNDRLIEYSGY